MISIRHKVFEVSTNSDSVEGRGHKVHLAYFVNHADAKLAAKGKGVMGTEATVEPCNLVINIYENIDEFNANTRENIRKRALAKLDAEERMVLGLNDE